MKLENTGFAGRAAEGTVGKETALMGREDPHSASPRGRGDRRAFSREGVERFLDAVREHAALLEESRSRVLEEYEQSCREQVTVRKVLKKNYVKLEIVMRPGKPRKARLTLAQQLEAQLRELRKSLGEDPRPASPQGIGG